MMYRRNFSPMKKKEEEQTDQILEDPDNKNGSQQTD